MNWVKPLSYAAFVYAILGYYNQAYFHWLDNVLFSKYSIDFAIVAFGIWRVAVEKVQYVRIRIAVLTFLIATIWVSVPLLTGSTFFDSHLIGSVWFFAYLIIIFLFGRRADCGWNCSCAGLRDTAGDAFRQNTVKGETLWKFRHIKWIPLALILIYIFLWAIYPNTPSTWQYQRMFWDSFMAIFFVSFLVVPVTGNRNFCRFLCPWGALYGLIGRLGFYKIEADRDKCTECAICDEKCEMGIPVSSLVKKNGEIKSPDCVGCGWCVSSCPTEALKFKDVRSYIKPAARTLGKLPLIRSKKTGVRIVGLLAYVLIILLVIKLLLISMPSPTPSTPIAPAQFSVTGLTVNPNEVVIGQEVMVTATVKNIGQATGTYGVELKVNDATEAVENVTLVPGESKSVTFRLVKQVPGKYYVDVDNLTQKFTVLWPPVTINLSGKLDQKGVVREDIEVVSADRIAVLKIMTGTEALDVDGRPISNITIVPTTAPTAPEKYLVVGSAYELTPYGASFQPPATLTLSYDPRFLPAGTDESQLKLAYFDATKGWVILECVVDPKGKFITAHVGGLGKFAVLCYYEYIPPIC